MKFKIKLKAKDDNSQDKQNLIKSIREFESKMDQYEILSTKTYGRGIFTIYDEDKDEYLDYNDNKDLFEEFNKILNSNDLHAEIGGYSKAFVVKSGSHELITPHTQTEELEFDVPDYEPQEETREEGSPTPEQIAEMNEEFENRFGQYIEFRDDNQGFRWIPARYYHGRGKLGGPSFGYNTDDDDIKDEIRAFVRDTKAQWN